jgi:hypothetical protein
MIAAEILSQGDEVVTGQVADTNAAWLSEQLTALGFDMVRHTAVGDRTADIVDAIRTHHDAEPPSASLGRVVWLAERVAGWRRAMASAMVRRSSSEAAPDPLSLPSQHP